MRPGWKRITFKVKWNDCTVSELGSKTMVIPEARECLPVNKSPLCSLLISECSSLVNILKDIQG